MVKLHVLTRNNEKTLIYYDFEITTVYPVVYFIRLESSLKMTKKQSFFGKNELAVLWVSSSIVTHVLQSDHYGVPGGLVEWFGPAQWQSQTT